MPRKRSKPKPLYADSPLILEMRSAIDSIFRWIENYAPGADAKKIARIVESERFPGLRAASDFRWVSYGNRRWRFARCQADAVSKMWEWLEMTGNAVPLHGHAIRADLDGGVLRLFHRSGRSHRAIGQLIHRAAPNSWFINPRKCTQKRPKNVLAAAG